MIVLTDKHNATEHSNKLVTLSTLNVMSDVIGVGKVICSGLMTTASVKSI